MKQRKNKIGEQEKTSERVERPAQLEAAQMRIVQEMVERETV
jgi:transposase